MKTFSGKSGTIEVKIQVEMEDEPKTALMFQRLAELFAEAVELRDNVLYLNWLTAQVARIIPDWVLYERQLGK